MARVSLRSWRYCVGARLKFWRRSRLPKKGSRDEAVCLAASPLVTAPPSNLTRLHYNGSAAKSHSTTTQYRQLRRLGESAPSSHRALTIFCACSCGMAAKAPFLASMSKKLSSALLGIVFTAETKIRTLGTRCTGKK